MNFVSSRYMCVYYTLYTIHCIQYNVYYTCIQVITIIQVTLYTTNNYANNRYCTLYELQRLKGRIPRTNELHANIKGHRPNRTQTTIH